MIHIRGAIIPRWMQQYLEGRNNILEGTITCIIFVRDDGESINLINREPHKNPYDYKGKECHHII